MIRARYFPTTMNVSGRTGTLRSPTYRSVFLLKTSRTEFKREDFWKVKLAVAALRLFLPKLLLAIPPGSHSFYVSQSYDFYCPEPAVCGRQLFFQDREPV